MGKKRIGSHKYFKQKTLVSLTQIQYTTASASNGKKWHLIEVYDYAQIQTQGKERVEAE